MLIETPDFNYKLQTQQISKPLIQILHKYLLGLTIPVANKNHNSKQGRSQNLESGRAVLLLAICRGFGFWLYCLANKGFLLLLFFLYLCRVCLLLVRTKLFCLKFFKGLSCLFLVKLVD